MSNLGTPGRTALFTFPDIYPDLSASSVHVFVSNIYEALLHAL
jgi:hypothetical protein